MFAKLKNNKLIKDGLYYTLGGFFLQGINFITVPIFTRLLSPNDYGIISIYSTWMGIISIFVVLQTYGTIGNAKISYGNEEFDEYISNSIILSTITFLFWIIVFYVFKENISKFTGLKKTLVFLMLFQSFFNVGITYKVNLAIYFSKPKKKLLISFLSVILNIGLSIYLIKNITITDKYMGRILGGFIPTLLLGGYFFLEIVLEKKPTFKKSHWKYCLSISLPLIFHNLSHLALNSSDRIMLEKFIGMKATGIYSFTYNIGMIMSILWGALNSAWVPWFYENMKNNRKDIIKKYSKIYLYFFTFLCIVFLIMIPEFIKIMAPKHYWGGINIAPWIVLGSYFMFYYSFPVNYEFYYKKTNYIAIGTTFSALINIALNFYFIPRWGAMGASLTTFISYIFLFIFHEAIVRNVMKDKVINLKDYILGIVILGITLGIYYKFLENIIIRYTYIILIGLLAMYTILKKLKTNK